MSPVSPPGNTMPDAEAVLDFWFNHAGPDNWFTKDPAFDAAIIKNFSELYQAAKQGEMDLWAQTASGALALIIVLDQFPRNMFRDGAEAFATDAKALSVAKRALETGLQESLSVRERVFLFLPFEHSEDPKDQERSVALFAALEDPSYLDWAEKHKVIIDRFGRFPHRNAALGRESTPDEAVFLKEPGSGF